MLSHCIYFSSFRFGSENSLSIKKNQYLKYMKLKLCRKLYIYYILSDLVITNLDKSNSCITRSKYLLYSK